MEFRLTSQLFVEPYEEEFLIYAPLKKVAFLGNSDTGSLIRALQEGVDISKMPGTASLCALLSSIGVVNNQPDLPPSDHTIGFSPTEAVVMPSADCSLKCIYCFSNGGSTTLKLNYEVAQAAVDFVINNASVAHVDPHLIFHGGGEPTLNWEVLVATTEYFKRCALDVDLQPKTSLVTNGLLSNPQVKWIEKHVDHITISLDGPPDIQNLHRPLRDGSGSFSHVYRTCSQLTNDGCRFGIRSTVTKHNVRRLSEIVELVSPFCLSSLQLEPMTQCGRCTATGCEPPDPELYVEEFKKAFREAKKRDMILYFSGSKFLRLGTRFCGAAGNAFCVLPDGHVSSCHRISALDDPLAEHFVYGRYDPSIHSFVFDEGRINELKKLHVGAAQACESCFDKWHCSGGCYHYNWLKTGRLLLDVKTDRCFFTRELTKFRLVDIAREGASIPQSEESH